MAQQSKQNDVLAELEKAKRDASAAIARLGSAAMNTGAAAMSATKSVDPIRRSRKG